MTPGEWLALRLIEHGIRVGNGWRAKIAAAADVSVPMIEKLMRTKNTPKIENQYAIARALGLESEFKAFLGEGLSTARTA